MAESINNKKVFSLLEVTNSIRKTIQERYQTYFWVKAEMNKLNHYSYSGHCYPELVEKNGGRVVAQIRASLWKEDFLRVNENFIRTLNEPLRDGITILFSASIQFDPVHGLSLRIVDIDPVFSLGELEREKLETLSKLKQEGIIAKNKTLTIEPVPKRIAVISVETSKGYSDFLNVLKNNSWGYSFFTHLFPALLQGDRSVDSIITQLKRVKKVKRHFDVVAIIRGGGGDVGLSSYNHYKLAREIAMFPIPVLTGIGHSTNETVAEMVAFRNAITPTELADFLIQKFHDFATPVQRAADIIRSESIGICSEERKLFANTIRYFRSVTDNLILDNRHNLSKEVTSVVHNGKHFITARRQESFEVIRTLKRAASVQHHIWQNRLSSVEKSVSLMDPIHVLRRGYTITLVNGKSIQTASSLSNGDQLMTLTKDVEIHSTVTNVKKSGSNE